MPCKSTDVFDREYIRIFSVGPILTGSVLDVCIVHWDQGFRSLREPRTEYLYFAKVSEDEGKKLLGVNEQILKVLKGATQAAQPCKDPFSASVEKKPKRIFGLPSQNYSTPRPHRHHSHDNDSFSLKNCC